jgi:DNA-binding NtrC family response regulator
MFSPRRILLADDDLSIRSGVADLLEAIGLEVLLASDGLEALELVKFIPVHAALLDMQMPLCGGLEALPLLRQRFAGLPCIVYSGNLTEATAIMAMEIGAFAALRKPVEPNLLRAEVLRAIESSPYLN